MSFKAPANCDGYLQVDLATPIASVPCTQLAWIKFETGIPTFCDVLSNGVSTSQCHRMKFVGTNRISLVVETDDAGLDVNAVNNDIVLDTWHLVAFVVADTNDHKLYINTLNGTHKLYESTAVRGPWVLNELVHSLGVFSYDLANTGGLSNQGEYLKIGETAAYNRALTVTELNGLSTGISPAFFSSCVAHYMGRQTGSEGDALISAGLEDSTAFNPDLTVRRSSDGTTSAAATPVVYSTDNPSVEAPTVIPTHVTFDVVIDGDDTPAPDSTGVSYKLSTGIRSAYTEKVYWGNDGVIQNGQMTILTPEHVDNDELVLSGDITPSDIYDEDAKHIRGIGKVAGTYTGQDVWLQFDGATQYLELT